MKTTSPSYSNLEQQRQGLLRQLADLRELRRGSLTEQFLTVRHADGSSVKRGPYPLLTRKQASKTVSVRLTDAALVPVYRQQVSCPYTDCPRALTPQDWVTIKHENNAHRMPQPRSVL